MYAILPFLVHHGSAAPIPATKTTVLLTFRHVTSPNLVDPRDHELRKPPQTFSSTRPTRQARLPAKWSRRISHGRRLLTPETPPGHTNNTLTGRVCLLTVRVQLIRWERYSPHYIWSHKRSAFAGEYLRMLWKRSLRAICFAAACFQLTTSIRGSFTLMIPHQRFSWDSWLRNTIRRDMFWQRHQKSPWRHPAALNKGSSGTAKSINPISDQGKAWCSPEVIPS